MFQFRDCNNFDQLVRLLAESLQPIDIHSTADLGLWYLQEFFDALRRIDSMGIKAWQTPKNIYNIKQIGMWRNAYQNYEKYRADLTHPDSPHRDDPETPILIKYEYDRLMATKPDYLKI